MVNSLAIMLSLIVEGEFKSVCTMRIRPGMDPAGSGRGVHQSRVGVDQRQ